MGKRRSNDRQVIAGRVGLSKIRYCVKHNEPTKAVKIFGHGMQHQCTKGCSLDKMGTILKVPEGPQGSRR
jgi:hypothetical protein